LYPNPCDAHTDVQYACMTSQASQAIGVLVRRTSQDLRHVHRRRDVGDAYRPCLLTRVARRAAKTKQHQQQNHAATIFASVLCSPVVYHFAWMSSMTTCQVGISPSLSVVDTRGCRLPNGFLQRLEAKKTGFLQHLRRTRQIDKIFFLNATSYESSAFDTGMLVA
jgi:hypothetical protein